MPGLGGLAALAATLHVLVVLSLSAVFPPLVLCVCIGPTGAAALSPAPQCSPLLSTMCLTD